MENKYTASNTEPCCGKPKECYAEDCEIAAQEKIFRPNMCDAYTNAADAVYEAYQVGLEEGRRELDGMSWWEIPSARVVELEKQLEASNQRAVEREKRIADLKEHLRALADGQF